MIMITLERLVLQAISLVQPQTVTHLRVRLPGRLVSLGSWIKPGYLFRMLQAELDNTVDGSCHK